VAAGADSLHQRSDTRGSWGGRVPAAAVVVGAKATATGLKLPYRQ